MTFYQTPRPDKTHCGFHIVLPDTQTKVGLLEMVVLERWGEKVGFLNFIYIDPAHRRKGYAMQALELMEQKVREMGLKNIDLNVLIHRRDAQVMYEKLGYFVLRRWPGGGQTAKITRVDMRKRLLPLTPLNTIAERLQFFREQLPRRVNILAVSKTQPVERIQEAIAMGQKDFGESYCQEAVAKIQQLNDASLVWHFIGPIQSNKTQDIAEHFQWVHSIEREKIAQRLNDQRPAHLPPLNVCIQVNIDQEPTKSGVSLQALPALIKAVATMPHLKVRGLMAIPAPRKTLEAQRQPFAKMRQVVIQLNHQFGLQLDTLSMGMSDDWQAAVIEGANWLRLGTAVFGKRV